MKKNTFIEKKLKDSEFTTKIYLYMSSTTAGDDYDPYEANYTYSNLNPLTVKGYVRELTPETAFYKQYGLHQSGMKEIICKDRWRNAFERCNKIEIDDIEYQPFKSGTGGKTLITKRPHHLIRVVVSRKD